MATINKSLDIEVEVTVSCYQCGESLAVNDENVDSWGDIKVHVEPCSACIEEAVEEAEQA